MADSFRVVTALKRALKMRGLTYAEVGRQLGVAESSVKRWFADGTFTLARIDQLTELLDLDLQDLLRLADQGGPLLETLSDAQEQALVSDMRLLLVGYLLLQRWTPLQISVQYDVEEHQLTSLLAHLDRLKLIELLPGNHVKMLVAPNFSWRTGGPIQQFFEDRVRRDFFESDFDKPGEVQRFVYGMLSDDAIMHVNRSILRLIEEYNGIVHQDRMLPPTERHGTSLVVALRRWSFSAFDDLKRRQD
ncbi:MAG: helix-turn-helix transcriptional regulator [Proteobacteria bacterium]|nr:helix-turn-helix transcriptional regulator [Pseudomonadota bacterium]